MECCNEEVFELWEFSPEIGFIISDSQVSDSGYLGMARRNSHVSDSQVWSFYVNLHLVLAPVS